MSDERRRYYRIEDEVCLAFEAIEQTEIDDRLEDFWANEHAFSIRNNYNLQIEQHIADRHMIEKKMPELARYLGVLEKQIDLISEKLIADDADVDMTLICANLSAQGISFVAQKTPGQGELVELKLKLLPSEMRLVIIARVVKIENDSGQEQDSARISLDFENLHEADREILIKHMHAKQLESLSKAKET
jgi:hypothetical protein